MAKWRTKIKGHLPSSEVPSWAVMPSSTLDAGQERERKKKMVKVLGGNGTLSDNEKEEERLYYGYCISFNAYWIFSNTLVMSVNPRREFVSRHRLLGCIIASKWGMSIHPSVQATFHLFSFVWDEDDDDWPSLPSQSLTPLGEKKAQKWVYSLGSMVGVGKQSFHLLSGFIANIKRIKELQRNLSHAGENKCKKETSKQKGKMRFCFCRRVKWIYFSVENKDGLFSPQELVTAIKSKHIIPRSL